MSAQSSLATRRSTTAAETNMNLDRPGLDELVPSRYAVQVGEIDVLVISDGVVTPPAESMATNADPAVRAAWLDSMARTYRDIAIEEMLGTVQEAMSQVVDWWGDLPPPMNEAIEQFRIELGAAIDSVEFVKKALSRQIHETDHGRGPP